MAKGSRSRPVDATGRHGLARCLARHGDGRVDALALGGLHDVRTPLEGPYLSAMVPA